MNESNVNITNEFNLIESFETHENAATLPDEEERKEALLVKHENNFRLISKIMTERNSKFRFENVNEKKLLLNESLAVKILFSSIQSSDGLTQSTYTIHQFCSEDFNSELKLQYKLIIPYCKKIDIRYDFYFSYDFMIHINRRIFSGIEFQINSFTFRMYDLNNHFIVECINEIEFNQFDKYCRVCLASFGFITGFVPMDCGYYFGYEKDNDNFVQFKFDSSFYSTYKTQFSLVSTNAYDFYSNIDLDFSLDENNNLKKDSRIAELEKKIQPISRDIFEYLVINMLNDAKLSEAIYLILSINNLKSFSFFLKAGMYAIVLEMLTSIIAQKNEEMEVEEILKGENANLKIKLQKELEKCAKKFFDDNQLKYDAKKSIVAIRINGLFTPLNQNKLLQAYEILEIPLSKQNKKDLGLRNQLLHGTIPSKDSDIDLLGKKLLRICLELNFLVNALIFKHIGYTGVLKNLATEYLDYTGFEELDKEYHKTI